MEFQHSTVALTVSLLTITISPLLPLCSPKRKSLEEPTLRCEPWLSICLYFCSVSIICNMRFDKDKMRNVAKINKWNIVGTKKLVDTIYEIINIPGRFALLWHSRKTTRLRTKRPGFQLRFCH